MRNLTESKLRRKLPKTILMTDDVRLPDPRGAVRALPDDSAVIVRHYADTDRAGLARALLTLCRPRKIPVLIAADPRLALAVDADGLHLPQFQLMHGSGIWRRWLRPGMLVSAAAHSPLALEKAKGVDFALLSPVFPTASHPGGQSIGVPRFAAWAAAAHLPVYALGGVNRGNERRISYCGAAGWAAIDGLSKDGGVIQ